MVESHIAYPTDAGLLSRGVKTVNRLVSKLKEAGIKAADSFVTHERTVKKLLEIAELTKPRTEEQFKAINRVTGELVQIAADSWNTAKRALPG